MTAARQLRYTAATMLSPLRKFQSYGANAFRILTFHHVRRHELPALEHLLDYLLEEHEVLTPAQAEEMASRPADQRRDRRRIPYLLTFDDGFRSNFEVARTILARRSIKAVFFVCPAIVGASPAEQKCLVAQNVFDGAVTADSLDPELSVMSWAEVADLRADGHAIGSHSASHRRLSTLTEDELTREIAGSAASLKEKLGEAVIWFAYPFGTVESISRAAYAVMRQTYRFCCSAVRGVNDGGSPMALFRENVELETPPHYQRFVCEGGLDFYYRGKRRQLLEILGQN